jgi:hypothetical protein
MEIGARLTKGIETRAIVILRVVVRIEARRD